MTHALVARLDNDGDVLLAGPAVRAVAAGASRVTLLVGPRGRAAAELLPGVDAIVEHRAEWIDPEPDPLDPARTLAFVERLRGLAVDRAIVLGSFHQSPLPLALLLRLADVPWVGATSVDHPGSLLDLRHRIDDDVHEVERSLDLVAAAGFPLPGDDDGALRVATADDEPPDLPDGYIVVHPGASVPARAWPAERHAALVGALATSVPVVVTGGPGERELTRRVAGPHPGAVDLGGRTTLGGLARVLEGARALVVGNTGPAHLAAAVGCPVVWIHAPTVPAVRWRPWRVPHVVVARDVPCAGCRARVCPVPGHPCMTDIGVPEVLAALGGLPAASREPAGAGAVA